jgi:hypothetical protein
MSQPAEGTPVATPTTSPTRADERPRRRSQPRRPRARQARVMIRKVGPWSVLKLSLLFYLCVMAVIVGAFVILYGILSAVGLIDSLTSLIRQLGFGEDFEINGDWLFSRGIAVGIAMAILWSLINVFVAFLYNLISDLVGGIEVTLSERR